MTRAAWDELVRDIQHPSDPSLVDGADVLAILWADAELSRLRAENERLAAIEKRAGDVGGIASELADADLEFELYCDNTKRLFAFAKASSDYILGR